MAGQGAIVVDARLSAYRRGGIPRYIDALASHLPRVAPDLPVSYLHNRDVEYWAARSDVYRVWTPPHFRWERQTLGWEVRRLRPRLLHATDFVAPRAGCPSIVTVHDLAFLRRPQLLDAAARRHYAQTVASARTAARVIAVSEYTAREVRTLLGIPAAKIVVIPNGVDPPAASDPAEPDEILAQEFGTDVWEFVHRRPVVLAVGTIEPRKRFDLLASVALELEPLDMSFILVGQPGWRAADTVSLIDSAQQRGHLLWLPAVSDRALDALYRLASVLAVPSLDEGFGLPALEALARGLPVVAARAGALPEVLGDAGTFVDDASAAAWAAALRTLLADPERRRVLTKRGIARAARLSWSETARRTAALYREVLRD